MSSETKSKPAQRNRYRKIEVRMWGDAKFRELSPMPPSGQSLWVFLLTGPHTSPIPGLFRSGRAAMAEELDWEQEAFDEAFREVFLQGMAKADWKAKVVWIPKAIQCNRPESPNVVLSWGGEWDLIPECELKRQAYEGLKASVYALGEGFAKAFDKAFGKPSMKPSTKTCANQEQEQEQDIPPGSPPARAHEVDDDVDGEAPPIVGEPFAMTADWQPSAYLPELARQGGLVLNDPEAIAAARAEFVAYWLTQPKRRTQHEWDHALIKSLKAERLRPPAVRAGAPPPRQKARSEKFDPVAYVNRNRKVNHDGLESSAVIDVEAKHVV